MCFFLAYRYIFLQNTIFSLFFFIFNLSQFHASFFIEMKHFYSRISLNSYNEFHQSPNNALYNPNIFIIDKWYGTQNYCLFSADFLFRYFCFEFSLFYWHIFAVMNYFTKELHNSKQFPDFHFT
jgi:hypothetical protein